MAQSVSDSEFELMKIIWESGGSAFYAQIAGRLAAEGNTWNKNTIITLLSRLVEKGMLRTDKFGRRNRYTALLSQEATTSLFPSDPNCRRYWTSTKTVCRNPTNRK